MVHKVDGATYINGRDGCDAFRNFVERCCEIRNGQIVISYHADGGLYDVTEHPGGMEFRELDGLLQAFSHCPFCGAPIQVEDYDLRREA